MRISILLQREPFGEILEETLAGFLASWTGQPYQVQWYAERPDPATICGRGQQPWLCNAYLNAIFVAGAEPWVLEPVRREFSRSLAGWRRLAQRTYVWLASSQQGARWLARPAVGIAPGLANARQLLIVAGNHKIRVLDRANGVAYGLRKRGFPPGFMQHEIESRRQAEAFGLPVPPLEAVAADSSWLRERYVVGTPVNRLADGSRVAQAVSQAVRYLQCLLERTMQEEPLGEYAGRLGARAQTLIEANHLLTAEQKRALRRTSEGLLGRIQGQQSNGPTPILTALTHGDWQPANILADGSRTWLIDWEYSARRQAGYDALVYASQSRFPAGLARRLRRGVERGEIDGPLSLATWPGLEWGSAAQRELHTSLFLLEELVLHLEENANPRFLRAGVGLGLMQREANAWLERPAYG